MADGRLAAVLVVGFVVFVGFGVAFVGTDDTPTEKNSLVREHKTAPKPLKFRLPTRL